MKYIYFIASVLLIISCNEQENAEKGISIISSDTIPEHRTAINPKPVADYTETAADALNKSWVFAVKVFETEKTFQYVLKIKFQELEAVDTLNIPNLRIQPVVQIQKGNEKYCCIVGFLDKEKKFREYKKVTVENNHLKITALKHYGVYSITH